MPSRKRAGRGPRKPCDVSREVGSTKRDRVATVLTFCTPLPVRCLNCGNDHALAGSVSSSPWLHSSWVLDRQRLSSPSRTRPEAIAVGLAGLRALTAATRLPVVGIGGIAARNAEQVLGADAAGVGVISAVSRAEEPAAAVRGLATIVWRCRTLRAGDGG